MAYLTALWRAGGFEANRSPGYRFQVQYNKETIEALKAAVPHFHREWNQEAQTWWVIADRGYEPQLEKLFTNFHALAFDQQRMEL